MHFGKKILSKFYLFLTVRRGELFSGQQGFGRNGTGIGENMTGKGDNAAF
jgi:hypothetical protein